VGTLHGKLRKFCIIPCSFLFRMRNVSDRSRHNQNTYFMSNNFFQNPAVYEIMFKNIAEPRRPRKTIWRIRIACWITKAASTNTEYVILTAFPLRKWWHERVSILRYKCIACLVNFLYNTGDVNSADKNWFQIIPFQFIRSSCLYKKITRVRQVFYVHSINFSLIRSHVWCSYVRV